MDVVANYHLFTSMVGSCRKGQKSQKLTLRPNESSMPNSPKKAKKEPKGQTKNFKAKSDQKGHI